MPRVCDWFYPKIFSFEKNETVYTIRLLPLGGYVRMAGEDADTVELKPGKKVGLVLNEKDEVVKLVFDGYESIPMFVSLKSNKLIWSTI